MSKENARVPHYNVYVFVVVVQVLKLTFSSHRRNLERKTQRAFGMELPWPNLGAKVSLSYMRTTALSGPPGGIKFSLARRRQPTRDDSDSGSKERGEASRIIKVFFQKGSPKEVSSFFRV